MENLPEDENNLVKSTLQKISKGNNKKLYKCNHNNCDKETINSHEISEKSFLNLLSTKESKLFLISPIMSGNALSNEFKETHQRNISVFPGYCREHDLKLFRELDEFSDFDDCFVNKQSLRTLKKEICKHSANITLCNEFIKEFEEIGISKEHLHYIYMVKNLQIQKERFKRLGIIYSKIDSGINNKKYLIKYKIFDIESKGYLFSTMMDFSKTNSELSPIFLYKLDVNNISKFIVGYMDNKDSLGLVNELVNENFLLHKIIYQEKDKLILSASFIENLNDKEKDILLQNQEIKCFGAPEYFFLKEILGLKLTMITVKTG